ncbi:MAG: hypothetical protein HY720_01995, partial [Planctomycetes bacterium]|nr:hypothetical protein [Planctomycetota bacterium]
MAIRFECTCGEQFWAPGDHSGTRVRCPGCGAELGVPAESVDTGLSGPISGLASGSIEGFSTVVLRGQGGDLDTLKRLIARDKGKGQLARYPVT